MALGLNVSQLFNKVTARRDLTALALPEMQRITWWMCVFRAGIYAPLRRRDNHAGGSRRRVARTDDARAGAAVLCSWHPCLIKDTELQCLCEEGWPRSAVDCAAQRAGSERRADMSQCAVAAGVAVCAGSRPRGPAKRPGEVRAWPNPCNLRFRDQHRGLAEHRGMVRSGPGHV